MQDRHRDELPFNRRIFLKSGIIFGGAALAGVGLLHGAEAEKKGDEQEAEVGPPEDLMREHGVLKRVLLIYGEALRRLDAKQDFPPRSFGQCRGRHSQFCRGLSRETRGRFSFSALRKSESARRLGKSSPHTARG